MEKSMMSIATLCLLTALGPQTHAAETNQSVRYQLTLSEAGKPPSTIVLSGKPNEVITYADSKQVSYRSACQTGAAPTVKQLDYGTKVVITDHASTLVNIDLERSELTGKRELKNPPCDVDLINLRRHGTTQSFNFKKGETFKQQLGNLEISIKLL